MNKSTAFFSCISMYMYKFPWHLCVQRCYILFTLHSLHTDVHKDAVFSSNFHVQDHCHTGHISKSLHISTHKKRHCILFLLCCMTLHSLLTLLYDTTFSSYSLVRYCIFFQLPCKKTLHSLLTVFNDTAFSSNCILFSLWCTRCTKLHFLQTAMYKDTAFPSYSGRKTPSYLLTLLMWDTAFSSHVHEQRHCILFTCPCTKTLHSLRMSTYKDTAFSSHVHEQRHCTLFTCPWTPELSHQVLHSLNKQEWPPA